jgi:hypothetical protein
LFALVQHVANNSRFLRFEIGTAPPRTIYGNDLFSLWSEKRPATALSDLISRRDKFSTCRTADYTITNKARPARPLEDDDCESSLRKIKKLSNSQKSESLLSLRNRSCGGIVVVSVNVASARAEECTSRPHRRSRCRCHIPTDIVTRPV